MKHAFTTLLFLIGCTSPDPGPGDAPDYEPIVPSDDLSQEVVCDAANRPFDDDVQVTEAGCTLTNILVDGDIFVRAEASVVLDAVAVTGMVHAVGAASLELFDAEVDLGVQLLDGGMVNVTDSLIDGHLTIADHTDSVTVTGNTISGGIELVANAGGVTVTDNTIGGDVACVDNEPAPMGEGNDVAGELQDQCAGL